jgi:hypothetical protein
MHRKLVSFEELQPGQRVRIHQVIDRRAGDWHATVTGVVRRIDVSPTVSWFAHGKDGRLWLWRVELQKPDGELSVLNVDARSEIELLEDKAAGQPA